MKLHSLFFTIIFISIFQAGKLEVCKVKDGSGSKMQVYAYKTGSDCRNEENCVFLGEYDEKDCVQTNLTFSGANYNGKYRMLECSYNGKGAMGKYDCGSDSCKSCELDGKKTNDEYKYKIGECDLSDEDGYYYRIDGCSINTPAMILFNIGGVFMLLGCLCCCCSVCCCSVGIIVVAVGFCVMFC